MRRDKWMETKGFEVLRFTDYQIRWSIEDVDIKLEAIW